jgi:anti-anti-sigma factor
MTEWVYDEEQQVGQLQVSGAVTVAQVGRLKEQLVQSMVQAEMVLVDLSRVSQVDIAGLQLLCAAHRDACTRGKVLKLCGGNERFRDLVSAAGFAHGNWCNAGEKTPCLWMEMA